MLCKARKRVGGGRRISKQIHELIFRMVVENPTWGAPRIHGELLMLGFDVSESTISRWTRRAPRHPDPGKRWLAFLRNHRGYRRDGLLHRADAHLQRALLFLHHQPRPPPHRPLQCHPAPREQLEAFPYQSAPEFLIFDHDAKYGLEVPAAIRSMKIGCVQTAIQNPWQNGIAERWVESCRRDLLDHVIALDERHLRRLLSQYVSYYHEDRTHLGLFKQTPAGRARSMAQGQVISQRRLGGLHHRYQRAA
jgi:putative transposase